ncbi:MAG: DMT family protein [Candidatus Binatia bacterium]
MPPGSRDFSPMPAFVSRPCEVQRFFRRIIITLQATKILLGADSRDSIFMLPVFIAFTIVYMRQPIKLDLLWAGFCSLGAVYFIFRS